jgi:fructose-bisphosphate aldolase class II
MLISMKEMLSPTRQHRFAIGAFNVADSCFIRAVVEEAEATDTPAIISIHPSELEFVTDAFFGYVRERTLKSRVPFTLHLDHGASVAHVLRAIQCGFTSVMIDGSLLPYEENDRGKARRFSRAARGGMLRPAQSMGCRQRSDARGTRLQGARHDELRPRLVPRRCRRRRIA